VAASSHPSRRERESERETTSRSRAGRSRWSRGRTDTTTVVLESQPQPTAGTTASPPAAVGPDTALLATRQLLNNPPPAEASPSAGKQWSHNVDQLGIAAINTPHRDGRRQPSAQQSRFPSAARAPSVAQAPPVLPGARPSVQHRASMDCFQTSDLREEINRRRGGEDSGTTIKRNREKRRDIEGRNLERDFDLHAPVGARQVAHAPLPPSSPGVSGGGGCMALAPHLRMVVWSPKFRLHLPEKYDGTVNPTEFLQIYSTSILAAGGNEAVMANYFPVALTRTARSWLMNLLKGTLHSWSELCRQFTANFKSAYVRPGNETDLHAIQQRPGNPCAPSSSGSLRFAISFLVSPMLL
jgi:hypothetical protein